jgi:hypothetical protein
MNDSQAHYTHDQMQLQSHHQLHCQILRQISRQISRQTQIDLISGLHRAHSSKQYGLSFQTSFLLQKKKNVDLFECTLDSLEQELLLLHRTVLFSL